MFWKFVLTVILSAGFICAVACMDKKSHWMDKLFRLVLAVAQFMTAVGLMITMVIDTIGGI